MENLVNIHLQSSFVNEQPLPIASVCCCMKIQTDDDCPEEAEQFDKDGDYIRLPSNR